MSFTRSVDPALRDEREPGKRGGSHRGDAVGAEHATATPLDGPAAMHPTAILQRQSILGNAHMGRVFRSPAPASESAPAAPGEEKQECQCADKAHCTCGG